MSEELSLTMEALEELYLARRARGWDLRVYDYSSNTWLEGSEAFSTPGTYERAVLTGPGRRPVRVRVLPAGGDMLQLDAASVRDMGIWRALGVQLQGRHLELLAGLLEGREDRVSLEELAALLRSSDDPLAGQVLEVIAPLLRDGGGGP
ncbi:MAG: hypothetical protein JSW25_00265 [Thermoplasmata archaeon]|nr:MAG: hypothetical protein JSW25_00265 [Thermoplasmata archaeon]